MVNYKNKYLKYKYFKKFILTNSSFFFLPKKILGGKKSQLFVIKKNKNSLITIK